MTVRLQLKDDWKSGIHDVRSSNYQHTWLVIHRPSGSAIGCRSRAEARRIYAGLKSGQPIVEEVSISSKDESGQR